MRVKICSKCGEEKGLSEFGAQKGGKDGLRAHCKVCRRAVMKRWQTANPEKVKAIHRKADKNYKTAHPERVRASKIKWQTENLEKAKASWRNWCKKNPEKARVAIYRWNAENPERVKANLRVYRAANPERVKAWKHTRRLLNGKMSGETIKLVYEDNIKRFGSLTCYLCLRPISPGKDELEHKTPLSRGGTNEFKNLAVACKSCNCRKHDKTVEEFHSAMAV